MGQGGMGAVYQARDLKRQAVCAIKEMSLSTVPYEEQEQAIENFKIEAKILWRLDHPNLPKFTGFFSENNRHFLVMEYIDGMTLEDLLHRNGGPFSERRVLGWARQLCDVLSYLHSQDPPIIFRDMKPGNAMLTRDGRIKLIDFGIARFFRQARHHDTQQLGTPGFAPPEQYGEAQTDERSDIYSLAMTLFELLTNTLSEKGFGLKNIRQSHPYISPAVARALEIATAIDPDDRYNSVEEFRSALLGEHTFSFESSEQATNPLELAELCALYPDEAADYLANGEIESWLREIGENDLARAARYIRVTVLDPLESVEQFIRKIPGAQVSLFPSPEPGEAPQRNGHSRGSRGSQSGKHLAATTAAGSIQKRHSSKQSAKPATRSILSGGRHKEMQWLRWSTPGIEVKPIRLDFGEVLDDLSEPLPLIISSTSSKPVQGTLQASDPWIVLDRDDFSGETTYVNVQIQSHLLYAGHNSGIITLLPTGKQGAGKERAIEVVIEADKQELAPRYTQHHGGKTIGADLNDEDDEYLDELDDTYNWKQTTGAQSGITGKHKTPMRARTASVSAQQSQVQSQAQDVTETPDTHMDAEAADIEKYGDPGLSDYQGWEIVSTTQREQTILKHIFTWCGAWAIGGLGYTLLRSLLANWHIEPLAPSPWFVFVLAMLIPTTSIGALSSNWRWTWRLQDILNRLCTGMSATLLALAVLKLFWQLLAQITPGSVQMIFMLATAAIAAIVGTDKRMSNMVIEWMTWALTSVRQLVIGLLIAIGGMLGFLLTIEYDLGWFTIAGMLVGMLVASSLLWRVHYIVKTKQILEDA
ncbi:serine/threonine-protein kinase [Ktedonobacter sp. SOSP1-85]|uniref:serine/threonine protein kinase n=1 Tax=Ktedonobacter sp. SOSP1-85 TaxID=2778367 RepID=UPI002107E554|nr:serine/threonine-protein kinase [Ktedonobacter sp. SOSP1-85]